MGMGPLYSCDGHADIERLLAAVRGAGIRIASDPTSSQAYWFRRGLGLVHGSYWGGTRHALYFGFGHPFNPFLWAADAKLLRSIEAVLEANGSRSLEVE